MITPDISGMSLTEVVALARKLGTSYGRLVSNTKSGMCIPSQMAPPPPAPLPLPLPPPPTPTLPPPRQSKITTRRMKLYAQGLSDSEIAAADGTTKTAIKQWRAIHGLPLKSALAKRTAAISRLYYEGLTDKQIATATSVSISTVIGWRHRHDLPPNCPPPEQEVRDG